MQKFKTKPFAHQLECLNKFGREEYFALLADMGTGKSYIIINNIADLWASHDLSHALIFAPNGVHQNWILQELPKHMPDYVRYRSAAYSSGMNKKEQAIVDRLLTTDSSELKILAMNWDALITKGGFETAVNFCTSARKLMIVGDESQNIKTPESKRTKQFMKLKPHADFRRIMSGTAIVNSPFDAFSQFRFLDENILQTDSYYAFKAEYAEILPPQHYLIQGIVAKKAAMTSVEKSELLKDYVALKAMIVENGRPALIEILGQMDLAAENGDFTLFPDLQQEMRAHFNPAPSPKKTAVLQVMARIDTRIAAQIRKINAAMNPNRLPQIVDKDKNGKKKYKNLDKLNALIAPHAFRVLKKDCLDLPEKIYTSAYFDLSPQQAVLYRKAEKEFRLLLEGIETPIMKLTAGMKLAQITSGYYLHPGVDEPVRIDGDNPKLDLLKERTLAIVENGNKVIIWARFRVQIDDIARMLRNEGLKVVEYHGGVKRRDRLENLDEFREGDADVFIGNQRAGGTGITIVESHHVIYFSNDFNAGDRWQSEDRAHRIGQTEDVIYLDLIGLNTIDEKIIDALVNKKDVADAILSFGNQPELV